MMINNNNDTTIRSSTSMINPKLSSRFSLGNLSPVVYHDNDLVTSILLSSTSIRKSYNRNSFKNTTLRTDSRDNETEDSIFHGYVFPLENYDKEYGNTDSSCRTFDRSSWLVANAVMKVMDSSYYHASYIAPAREE